MIEQVQPPKHSSKLAKPSRFQPEYYRARMVEQLGGDAFLTRSGLEYPFLPSAGCMPWKKLAAASKLALRMTPRAERKNDGSLPSILVQSINTCIRTRKAASNRAAKKLVELDLSGAVRLMQSEAAELASKFISRCSLLLLASLPVSGVLDLLNQLLCIFPLPKMSLSSSSLVVPNLKTSYLLTSYLLRGFRRQDVNCYLRSPWSQNYGETRSGRSRS